MAKVSFDEALKAAEQADKVEKPAQDVTVVEPSKPVPYVDDDDCTGEITSEDILIPRLAIVNKIGELSELFPGKAGALALNKELLVAPGESIDVIAIKIRKQYEQNVGFDSGKIGLRFPTAEAAVQAGGTIDKNERESENFYNPSADIVFLIKQPDNIDPALEGSFFYDVGGVMHAAVLYTSRSTSYAVAQAVFTLKQQRGSVWAQMWKFRAVKREYNGKTWYAANLRPNGITTPDYAEFIKTLPKL